LGLAEPLINRNLSHKILNRIESKHE